MGSGDDEDDGDEAPSVIGRASTARGRGEGGASTRSFPPSARSRQRMLSVRTMPSMPLTSASKGISVWPSGILPPSMMGITS